MMGGGRGGGRTGGKTDRQRKREWRRMRQKEYTGEEIVGNETEEKN